MANYSTYPMKVMKITQNYLGTTSHKPHTTGNIKDYPIDDGGADTGKDPIYATSDFKIVKIYGVGNSGTNTIWLTSVDKLRLPNGKTDYLSFLITHPDDVDLKGLKVGQIIKKGSVITKEGKNGATGNHVHLAVGMGTVTGSGWSKNNNGKWVLTTSNGTIKPEEAWYIDKSFTTVKSAGSIKFKDLPDDKSVEYITNSALNCRSSAGTKGKIIKVYSKGTHLDIIEEKKTANEGIWGKTAEGWVSLTYCHKA